MSQESWQKALFRRMEYIYHSGKLPTSDTLVSATSVRRYFSFGVEMMKVAVGAEGNRGFPKSLNNLGGCVDRRFTARTRHRL